MYKGEHGSDFTIALKFVILISGRIIRQLGISTIRNFTLQLGFARLQSGKPRGSCAFVTSVCTLAKW